MTRDLIKIAEKYTIWISHTKKTHVNIHNFHCTLFGVSVVLWSIVRSRFALVDTTHRPLTGFSYLLSHSISFVMQNNVHGCHNVGIESTILSVACTKRDCMCVRYSWNSVLIWCECSVITVIVVKDVTDSKFTYKPVLAFVYRLRLLRFYYIIGSDIYREFSLIQQTELNTTQCDFNMDFLSFE